MAHVLESPSIEVRCPSCDVSYPVGQRRCIHCGGRLGRQVDPEVASALGDIDQEVEQDAQGTGRRLLRSSFTGFWVIVLVVSAVIRACQQNPG